MTASGKTIGILGGGQLARMLLIKGHEMGLDLKVLTETPSDPAAQVTSNWTQGSPHNLQDLKSFLKAIDILTFESEFIDCKLLKQAIKESKKNKLKVYPSIENMSLFQDRWSQKKLLQENGLRTSRFVKVDSSISFEKEAHKFSYIYVLKKRFGGYDGYGTFISKSKKDHLKISEHLKFSNIEFSFIMEDFIPFKRELACQFFRGVKGEFFHLPLVESHQENSKCDWVIGPIEHPNFGSISHKIKSFMEAQNYTGTLAFEFFDYQDKLWINETAPRVHNSGHYSLNYPLGDQFSLHLKSISGSGLPVVNKKAAYSFAMINLIGKTKNKIKFPINISGFIHWYGKSENRPGRKMGHINYIDVFSAKNAYQLLKKALKERSKFNL